MEKNIPTRSAQLVVFGRNVRFLRKLKGLTQAQLAEQLSVNRSRIAGWELGSIEPDFEKLFELAAFLEVAPEELLAEDFSQIDLEDHLLSPISIEHQGGRLQELASQTLEAEKALEGFRELVALRYSNADPEDEGLMNLFYQWDNLSEIFRLLIRTNWDFLGAEESSS